MKQPTKRRKKLRHLRRTWIGGDPPSLLAYATLIGEVAYYWNFLHGTFLALFTTMVDPHDSRPGANIWHSLSSDRAQRDMLVAIAKARLGANSRLLTNVLWATKAAATLSDYRNTLIHTRVAFFDTDTSSEVIPFMAAPKHAKKFQELNINRLQRQLKGDLFQLSGYVGEMLLVYVHPTQQSLYRRPRLQLIPKSHRKSQKGRPRQEQKALSRLP